MSSQQYPALGALAPSSGGFTSPWHASERPDDGWIGTRELPGYRAGRIVAKLADLPGVDAQHLYFDLLLLDADGRTAETLSGPCAAMARDQALDERSRFVHVVAELLRHAADPARGLTGLASVLDFIRTHGIAGPKLAIAAQQLDSACSERALVASLGHMLRLSLGDDEAQEALRGVLASLARSDPLDGTAWRQRDSSLPEQVACVVRIVGKTRARRALRDATDFDLLPSPELLGLG